ncbi:MAG: type II toxin-antitoxin system ParD family antitoxin [Terracidiphilus sp.]|jgi:putative addiction module CopG family antidote
MQNRFVQVPPGVFELVQNGVDSGRYNNAGEVFRVALRALHREQEVSEQLRQANSIAEGDVFRKLWEKSVHVWQEPRVAH